MNKFSHQYKTMKQQTSRFTFWNADCEHEVALRNFPGMVRLLAVVIILLVFLSFPVRTVAESLVREDFEQLVPSDKKLDPAWVQSLTERGEPAIYRGTDLKYIGMPVGGLFAGQLYLGGDGKLWHWNIFNDNIFTGAEHYAKPMVPSVILNQGFALKISGHSIPLDGNGFKDVTFRGEYPVGTVEFKDPSVPVTVKQEAFSPFIPLNTGDSSLPATLMRFTLRNTSNTTVELVLSGSLENAVALHHRDLPRTRQIKLVTENGFTFLDESAAEDTSANERPEVVIEDWNKETYTGWKVEGTAFGNGPVLKKSIPNYQGDVGGDTERVVNSHASAPGNIGAEKDNAMGKLTGKAFPINRNYLFCWLGGGNNPGKTGLNLLIDGQIVASVSGKNKNLMDVASIDLRQYQGKQGVVEIVDNQAGSWGNVGVGRIFLSDQIKTGKSFNTLSDVGTMGLLLLGAKADLASNDKTVALKEKLVGELGRNVKLAPGESATVTFAITWFFPNLNYIPHIASQGQSYANRFGSALAVARYIAGNENRLMDDTFLWKRTWYDSTLPYWFLDRTFMNISILATTTSFRFKDGRYWAWEGVGDCRGTCGHVYYYGQACGRLFPDIERDQREKVDFILSQNPDGSIRFRGENGNSPAIDAQAGYILRAYREHQMSTDDAFLKRIWPKVKLAMDWMIARDGTGDGIIKGNQHNTLDADWFGANSWLSGVYQAALRASAEMADRMADPDYAKKCRQIADIGRDKMAKELFNGEYFQNKVDPRHLDSINSGSGCEIDQVMGQSWAFQVGLPRVFPRAETLSALKSLWRYNFTPDVGPYRAVNKPGRWYAMPGESGLLMCTFPRKDWDYVKAAGKGNPGFVGYFNECMNGFEHQVAGHMIWEGMVREGLAIERALHDRYSPSKRNPYNEIECGDHYGRSMASYGVFLAACGFEYDGPRGHIGFAPKISPADFKAPFTSAEGWGTFSQQVNSGTLQAALALKWGKLRLKTLALELPAGTSVTRVVASMDGKSIPASPTRQGDRVLVTFATEIVIPANSILTTNIN